MDQMAIGIGRRKFISAFCDAAVAWPLAVRAQQQPERMRRVEVVMNLPEHDTEAQRVSQAFVIKLQELGWKEDRNLVIDFRWVGDNVSELQTIVKKTVNLRPDVIVGRSGSVLLALQQETSTIPIVFVDAVDPVEVGLVKGLARPGGNITGFMNFEPAIGSKWLEIVKEIAPSVGKAVVLLYPQQSQELIFRAIEEAGYSFKIEVSALRVRDAAEIERGINSSASGTDGSLIVLANSITNSNRELVADVAIRHRLPSIYAYRSYIETGGLVSYGIEPTDPFRNAAIYVDRILKGEKPADLPVQAPTKFELVINLKTAKALGLTVPSTLLSIADEVIE
jgi:putative tryptophan/tyrosine transport system substrate-binding protein